MWIRYLERDSITESQQVWQHRFGQEKYLFPRETGLCDIRNKKHLSSLLAIPSRYELAYEKYGVAWDGNGAQVDAYGAQVEANGTGPVALEPGMNPPLEKSWKEMSMKERMAKMRAARRFEKVRAGLS